MNNRAKCKACLDIIESKSSHDYVTCSCGRVSIDGGPLYSRMVFDDPNNVLFVDDEGNEVIPNFNICKNDSACSPKPTKEELLDSFDHLLNTIKALPKHIQESSISHSDIISFLELLSAILKMD